MVWIMAAETRDPDALAVVALRDAGSVVLAVSQHSLLQLEAVTDRFGTSALDLAKTAVVLPCYPTGSISELVGPIDGLAGSLSEVTGTDQFRLQLADIATSGTDLRDRGALIDTYRFGASWFVTNDKGLVGSGPQGRIRAHLGISVVRPADFVARIRAVPA